MTFLLFILVIIDNLNVLLANNDNCRVNDLNALMVRLRQLPTEFNDLKIQHDATQAEIKVLKEANGKQETELENLRQEINNKSTEIKLINEENRKQETELEELRQEINKKSTEIKLIKEENKKQETELEELRQDVNNKSLEIAAISKDIEMIKGIDDCMSSPCQNGATCNDGVNSYTCMCPPGYTGTYCDTDIDDCSRNQCQNGATCVDGVNSYTCSCEAGYNGTLCEIDIDDCNPNPCQNGAACTDRVDSYTCTCVAGYTGTNCETDIDDCNPNPCQSRETCTDGVDSYTCMCVAGYTGTNCETDIDECNPDPCQNGATCIDGIDSYTCTCDAGYTGTNCETEYCPANWYFFQESCYYTSTKSLNWSQSEKDCIALGGHLVEITSEQENNFIASYIVLGNYDVWIGLNDRVTEGVYVWVSSGNTASGVYTKWGPGETNNSAEDCVYMHHSTGYWHDYSCSGVTYYICEKESMFA